MNNDDYKNIERIIIRQPDDSNSDIFSNYNIFIFREGLKPEVKTFTDKKECINYAANILESKYASIDEAEARNEEDKFIMAYNPTDIELDNMVMAYVSKRIDNPEIIINPTLVDQIMTGNVVDNKEDESITEDFDDDYITEDNEKKSKHKTLKRVGAITAVGAILAGVITPVVVNIAKSNDAEKVNDLEEEIDYSKLDLEEIIKKLEDGSLAKKEYTKVLEFCKSFNDLTKQPKNFYLENDGINHLTISAEEALYTSVVLNDYNADQLMQIFGTKTLDYDEVMKAYNSVCEKIKIYNMNAKIPSGIDTLMNNSGSYRNIETSVLEFNRNNNKETSDRVILTFKNNIAGFNEDKDINAATINMAAMPIKGYMDANVNNIDDLEYRGSFGEDIISSGTKLNEIKINIANYFSKVGEQLKQDINEYNSLIASKLSTSKDGLIKALKNNGNESLAEKVELSSNIDELENEIISNGADFVRLYEEYKDNYNALNPSGISANIIINKIDQEVLDGSTCNLRMLQEHRIREGKIKEKEDNSISDTSYSNNNDIYTYEDNDIVDVNLSEDGSATDDEKEPNDYTESLYVDSDDYINTPGAYHFDGVLNAHFGGETTNQEEIETRKEDAEAMTPYQLWVAMMMDGYEIDLENDKQIQEAKYKTSNTNDWDEAIAKAIANAGYDAQERLAELERDYNNNQDNVNDLNNNDVIIPSLTSDEDEINYIGETSVAEDGIGYAEVVSSDEIETEDFDNYGGYSLMK